jgi:hypothetical protein
MPDMTFQIPRKLWHSLNRYPTNAGHRNRLRQDLHALVRWHVLTNVFPVPRVPVEVTWTVCYPAGTTDEHGDPVNASPVTKALLDGLVHAHVLPDDGPSVVLHETFRRGPNRPKKADEHRIILNLETACPTLPPHAVM